VNSRRLIATLYAVLLVGMGVAAGALFVEAQGEYQMLKKTEAEGQRQLAEAKAQLAKQTETLRRLREDRDYVEKVIRQRLGYGMPGEMIHRFPQ
jgi:cell division protein DivIC